MNLFNFFKRGGGSSAPVARDRLPFPLHRDDYA